MQEKRQQVVATLHKIKQEAAPILRVLDADDPTLLKQLKANGNFTMQYLEAHENVRILKKKKKIYQ